MTRPRAVRATLLARLVPVALGAVGILILGLMAAMSMVSERLP